MQDYFVEHQWVPLYAWRHHVIYELLFVFPCLCVALPLSRSIKVMVKCSGSLINPDQNFRHNRRSLSNYGCRLYIHFLHFRPVQWEFTVNFLTETVNTLVNWPWITELRQMNNTALEANKKSKQKIAGSWSNWHVNTKVSLMQWKESPENHNFYSINNKQIHLD